MSVHSFFTFFRPFFCFPFHFVLFCLHSSRHTTHTGSIVSRRLPPFPLSTLSHTLTLHTHTIPRTNTYLVQAHTSYQRIHQGYVNTNQYTHHDQKYRQVQAGTCLLLVHYPIERTHTFLSITSTPPVKGRQAAFELYQNAHQAWLSFFPSFDMCSYPHGLCVVTVL